MKLVKEYIYEEFTEKGDPIQDMNIGTKNQILKDLKELNLDETDVEFYNDFTFFLKDRHEKHQNIGEFISIQLKYFPDGKKELLEGLERSDEDVTKLIDKAINAGVNLKDITYIINYALNGLTWGETRYSVAAADLGKAKIHLAKLSRSKKKIKEENKDNIYVFIGFMEKAPVIIKGEKYYKERFQVEKMVKFDKYNVGALHMIYAMKLRAQSQYGRQGVGVYMLTVPKDYMDEESYNGIPEENRYIIEKYKKRI